jgi:hypothetical protein
MEKRPYRNPGEAIDELPHFQRKTIVLPLTPRPEKSRSRLGRNTTKNSSSQHDPAFKCFIPGVRNHSLDITLWQSLLASHSSGHSHLKVLRDDIENRVSVSGRRHVRRRQTVQDGEVFRRPIKKPGSVTGTSVLIW